MKGNSSYSSYPSCSDYSEKLLSFLRMERTSFFRDEEKKLIEKIEKKREVFYHVGHMNEQQVKKLQLRRVSFSNTLQKDPEKLSFWNKAQEILHNWIQEGKNLCLSDYIHLNNVLTGGRNHDFRDKDIYTSLVKHAPPEDVFFLMKALKEYLEELSHLNEHPLYEAFISRYWTVSIHPFREGNGRTSQLLSDYYLLKNGFLPQSFFSKLEVYIIGDPLKLSYMTPHKAFTRFCHSVLNSYEIALNPCANSNTYLDEK